MADIIYGATGINFAAHGNVGGMTSELLDDYEEGTWTAASAVGTVSNQSHTLYTKIGRNVLCQSSVTFGSTSNGSNQKITGLPFASDSTGYGSGTVGYSNFTAGSLRIIIWQSRASMYFFKHSAGGTNLDAAGLASKRTDFTVFYLSA